MIIMRILQQGILWAVLLLSLVVTADPCLGAGPGDVSDPLLAATILKEPIEFCGERVPLDNLDIRERLEKQLLLLAWDRPQVLLWLKRSDRYFPVIEKILRQNDMPEDLKYVAIVESGLRPHAGSSRGAVGFWQFIAATGRRYGLTISGKIDERRNIYTSTRAAVRYLRKLHQQFQSWSLAVAAYNMGEDRLEAAMKRQGVTDYYQCDLSRETEAHLPKLIAVKMIFSDPARFGFTLRPEDRYQPRDVDRVVISNSREIPIRLIAEAAGSYYKEIKDLNPELRGDYLAAGSRTLAIPKGNASRFHASYRSLLAQWLKENKRIVYVVKKGDSLSVIAQRFKVSLPRLLAWNDIKKARYLYPGEKLFIYQ